MSKKRLLILAAIIIAPIALGLWAFLPSSDALEDVLREHDFYPIKVPSMNYTAGAHVQVSENGRIKGTVCELSPDLQKKFVRMSNTEGILRTELTGSRFEFKAKVLETINTAFGGNAVKSVTLNIQDVTIDEVVSSSLKEILSHLLEQSGCEEAVQQLVLSDDYVCISVGSLRATVHYQALYDRTAVGSGAVDPEKKVVDAVSAVVEKTKIVKIDEPQTDPDDPQNKSDGGATVQEATIRTGKDLVYGMKLHPLCVTMQGKPEVSAPGPVLDRFEKWLRKKWRALI